MPRRQEEGWPQRTREKSNRLPRSAIQGAEPSHGKKRKTREPDVPQDDPPTAAPSARSKRPRTVTDYAHLHSKGRGAPEGHKFQAKFVTGLCYKYLPSYCIEETTH
ncbi:uncharacterized protein B0H18DRAFT_964619 [Fomitopsis serialis]|uniref:uncharacterized protein n=1 Tax=Fomitopsis serialis TaxID=139415 RepID=UPI002008A369|nr:uncharacterized protein B0H18DRAFT_964619 [Neoantrodia serialis]KAH9907114.1 hypothetical protein B0H18DRAFT_964619 [Neoantrodia serialis]